MQNCFVSSRSIVAASLVFLLGSIIGIYLALAADGEVLSYQKISDTEGSFSATLDDNDQFGYSVENIGDLNSDGVNDLVVGALNDDDGNLDRGAVYILFMDADGTLDASAGVSGAGWTKISDTEGSFNATLDDEDFFGSAVTGIGDLNGDGVLDIAVSAISDDDGGSSRGAVYILFLDADGTLDASAGVSGAGWTKISDTEGSFNATLGDSDQFGVDIANIGDLNGDGVTDLVVGANGDDDGGLISPGAVYVLFMDTDGSLDASAGVSGAGWTKISDTEGSFDAVFANGDNFGFTVGALGDLNSDGAEDIVVGVPYEDDGGTNRGALYVLFLDTDGSLDATAGVSGTGWTKISDTEGSFDATLVDNVFFGISVSKFEDVNNDGVTELVVGASNDAGGGAFGRGAVYILFLDTDGSLDATAGASGTGWTKISDTEGNFSAPLVDGDSVGWSVSSVGDLNGDGKNDIVAGAPYDNDGDSNRGAIYTLFLDAADATAPTVGGGGAITLTPDFFTMDTSWTAATDDTTAANDLTYKLYFAAAGADLDSVADIEANGTLLATQTSGDVTYTHTGLQPNTTYTYNVIVSDEALNKAAYTQATAETLYPSQVTPTYIERPYFNIRGDACTWDRNIILEIGGKNIQSVVVSDNPQFLNASWQPFRANTTIFSGGGPVSIMEIRKELPRQYDTYTYYALVKSVTGNQSRTMVDSITLTRRADCTYPSRQRVPYFGRSDAELQGYYDAIDKAMDLEEEIEAERKAQEEANAVSLVYVEGVKEGDLIKTSNDSALYYVARVSEGTDAETGLTRHAFPNEQIFSTWYSTGDMKRAKIVSDTTMTRIPLKGTMPPKSGSTLVTFENDKTVYLPQIDINAKPSVTPYNVTLRPITTLGLTEELFGKDYKSMILTLPESLKPQMTIGRAITKFDASISKLKSTMKRW